MACVGIAQSTHTLYFQNSNTGKGIQDLLLFDNAGLIGITDAKGKVTISTPKTQIYVKHISYKDSIINLKNVNNTPIQLETRITQMPDVKIEAKYNPKKHLLKLLKQNFTPDKTRAKDTIVFYELEMETEVQDQLMPKEIIHAIVAVKLIDKTDVLFSNLHHKLRMAYWVKAIKYESQIKDSLTNAFLPKIDNIPLQILFNQHIHPKKLIKYYPQFQMIKDNKTKQTKFNLVKKKPSVSAEHEINFIFYNDTLLQMEQYAPGGIELVVGPFVHLPPYNFNSYYYNKEFSTDWRLHPKHIQAIISLTLDNNKIVYQTIKLTEIEDKTFDKQIYEKNAIWLFHPRDEYFTN